MRQPKILDVVRAVTAVAPAHPEVRVWWYSPPVRFHLRGEAEGSSNGAALEIFLELGPEARIDFEAIAAELSARLWGNPVSVQVHGGRVEGKQLFRILTREHARAGQGGAAEPPARSTH